MTFLNNFCKVYIFLSFVFEASVPLACVQLFIEISLNTNSERGRREKGRVKAPVTVLGYLVRISTPLPLPSFLAFTEHRHQPKVKALSLLWSSQTLHPTLDSHRTFEIPQCKRAASSVLIFPKKLSPWDFFTGFGALLYASTITFCPKWLHVAHLP